MIEKIQRINRILSLANRCYHISKDLASSSFYQEVRYNDFLRFSRGIYFYICIVELAKLFQRSPSQEQNLYSFLDNLKINENIIEEDEIKRWKTELESADLIALKKIVALRNKLFAHLDSDFMQIIEQNPLSFKEVKSLLDIAIRIVREVNNKFGGAELEYKGSPAELECAYAHLTKLKDLLAIEERYNSSQ